MKSLSFLSSFYPSGFQLIMALLCDRYKKRFHKFDKESKGFITTVDVQQVLEVSHLPSSSFCRPSSSHTRLHHSVIDLCRASTSTLMRMRSTTSLTRWTSTRTDKWKLMNSCRYVTWRRSARRQAISLLHLLQFVLKVSRQMRFLSLITNNI